MKTSTSQILEVIDILKGLQCIDGEYNTHRENELYKALRLLESVVADKPVTQTTATPETSVAGLWADEKPTPGSKSVTVTIDEIFDKEFNISANPPGIRMNILKARASREAHEAKFPELVRPRVETLYLAYLERNKPKP